MKKIICLISAIILIIATNAFATSYDYNHKSYHKSWNHKHKHVQKKAVNKKHRYAHKYKYRSDFEPAPYIGGMAGWGRIDEGSGYKEYIESLAATPRNIERGTFTTWSVVIGYLFTPYFALEAGYTYYPDNNYTCNTTDNINIKTYTADLVGKFIIPFKGAPSFLSKFSIFGKAGAAYENTKVDTMIASSTNKTSNSVIRPTVGAGIIFNLKEYLFFDASWTGIFGKNKVNLNNVTGANPTPDANRFTLGLYYKFTGIF